MRLHRRARAFCARQAAATGLGHLSNDMRDRLAVLRHGADVVAVPSEHRADEIAGEMHLEMPWMGPATERAWHAMRASVRDGDTELRLPPLLLVGPPGVGKSHGARSLGRHLGVPTTVIDATGEPALWAVIGLQKGWGAGDPGRPHGDIAHGD